MDREAAEGNYSSWDFCNKLPVDGHQADNQVSQRKLLFIVDRTHTTLSMFESKVPALNSLDLNELRQQRRSEGKQKQVLPIHVTVPDNRSPSRKENSGCIINIRPVSGVSDLLPGDVSKHNQSLSRRELSSCYDADRTLYCVSMTNGWEVPLNKPKNVKYFCKRLADCTRGRYHAQVAWTDGNPASPNSELTWQSKEVFLSIYSSSWSLSGRKAAKVSKQKMSQTRNLIKKLPSEGCVCMQR